jgi:hypothetical protein
MVKSGSLTDARSPSRVELVLYALSHGGSRQAEWVAGVGA